MAAKDTKVEIRKKDYDELYLSLVESRVLVLCFWEHILILVLCESTDPF